MITINGVQKVIETHDNDQDGDGDGANTKIYLAPTTGIQVSVPGDDADNWASRANGFGRPPALIPAAAGETSAGTEIPLSDVSFGGFDKVLRCTGWRMDTSIFDPELAPIFEYADDIYPTMESPFSVEYTGVDAGGNETVAYAPTSHWEHPTVPGLYFAGALMRPSEAGADAGAEGWSIASLRHRVKALHRILELRNHGMCDPDEQLAWGDRHDARVKTEGCIGWEIPGVLGMPWPVHEVAFLGALSLCWHSGPHSTQQRVLPKHLGWCRPGKGNSQEDCGARGEWIAQLLLSRVNEMAGPWLAPAELYDVYRLSTNDGVIQRLEEVPAVRRQAIHSRRPALAGCRPWPIRRSHAVEADTPCSPTRQVYIPELMSRVNQSVWRVHHGNFTLGQFWTVGYEASADTPQLHPVWRFNCWDDTSCAAANQEAYHMAPDAHGVWDQPQHARALGREFFGPKLVWEWTEEELEENAREVERNRKKAEEKKRQREEKKRAKDQVEHARWAEREGERLIQMEDYGADTLSKQDLSARTWGSICAACKSECNCLPPRPLAW